MACLSELCKNQGFGGYFETVWSWCHSPHPFPLVVCYPNTIHLDIRPQVDTSLNPGRHCLPMRCLQASRSLRSSKFRVLFPKVHGFASSAQSVVLRPYQQACLDACHVALNAGVTRIGVSLPTGAGKTTVFTTLLSQIPSPKQSPRASRSLIIVNSVELARQAAAHAEATNSDWKVEIEQGTKHEATGLADV